MKISKILVTGGAGYIGSHVVFSLLKQGYQVIVLDDFSAGKRENIPSEALVRKASILDMKAMSRVFSEVRPDAVIHLAALKAAGKSMTDALSFSDTNITGTINLLRAMVEHRIYNMVFSSSAAVYGEPQYLPVDESHLLDPINYYGATKLVMEQILEWYAKIHKIKYVALRYFNAAGHMPSDDLSVIELEPQNLIPIVLEVAIGKRKNLQIFGDNYNTPDGTCIRDYIHISDLAEAHILSLTYLESNDSSLALNLGTGKGVSVKEVYDTACEVTGKKISMKYVDRRSGDSAALYAKSILAQKKINWYPQYTNLRDIIQHGWDVCVRKYNKK